ncbi:MAG: NAD(P)H-hydrate dehydratase [Clostridiales bacterium]|nr:NAD(P)H-hydrate dehydratase [Clostridiales bacterium]
MLPVLTSNGMRLAEKKLFDAGASSYSLMEKAGRALAERALSLLPPGGTAVFACGGGGNGGDGYAAARMLSLMGARVVTLAVYPPATDDCVKNCRLAGDSAFAACDCSALDTLPRPDLWVDCVFGIGLNRAPDETALRVFRRMNADRRKGSKIVCCDIPSGLDPGTGEYCPDCPEAEMTVTFQFLKLGQLLGRGRDVCGLIETADIGIPSENIPDGCAMLVEDSDVRAVLPRRRAAAHKNEFGHLLILAGSKGMAGAAALCALAACRSGAGLVTVACPESCLNIVQTLTPTTMCLPLPETDGMVGDAACEKLANALKGKTSFAAGPGLGRGASKACLRLLMQSSLPGILDADALNIISQDDALKSLLSSRHALTPHPGEAARLTAKSGLSQTEYASLISGCGCAALIKGASSVIMGKSVHITSGGACGMAKGGSGDALTGITGALLAQGLDPETALWAGSHIHALAGRLASDEIGDVSMLPTDLIDMLPKAFKHVYA